jgi:hypothetical protein
MATAMLVEQIARLRPEARLHYQGEQALLDGYSSGASENTRVSFTAELTPTEAVAEARLHLDSQWRDLEAGIQLLNATAINVYKLMGKFIGYRVPGMVAEAPRCTGGVPDCTNVPSTHTLASGALHDALCDSCFTVACHVCGKPRDEQRRVDDRQACGACYRRHLRSQGRAA